MERKEERPAVEGDQAPCCAFADTFRKQRRDGSGGLSRLDDSEKVIL